VIVGRTGCSVFDSARYGGQEGEARKPKPGSRSQEAEWLFPKEKATLQDFKTSTWESKML